MRIILAYHTITKYDAIAVDIMQEYVSLKKHGHDVFIFAEHFDSEYCDVIIGESMFLSLAKSKDTKIIYHHGGYWNRGNHLLAEISSDIYLKYHNVTPSDFFVKYNADFYNYALLGRKQTQEFVASGKFSFYIVDSNYNAAELKHYGVQSEKIAISPPFHRINEFEKIQPDLRLLQDLLDGKINLLFIGRVAPNKGHKHLINTVEKYVRYYGYDVRVNIVGGIDPKLIAYYDELTGLVNNAGLNNIISFKKHVSLSELFSYYIGSHAFLLLSEHEGFCVPILEAQYHHLPIIALDRGAVKETLGSEQLCFAEIDYDDLSAAIHLVVTSLDIRMYLAAKGRENYLNYTTQNLEKRFIDAVCSNIE